MYPKTIRLRPEDQADLEYLTMVTGLNEGAVIRCLLARTAAFVRDATLAQEPGLAAEAAWAGGTGTLTTRADRQAWTAWQHATREGSAHE